MRFSSPAQTAYVRSSRGPWTWKKRPHGLPVLLDQALPQSSLIRVEPVPLAERLPNVIAKLVERRQRYDRHIHAAVRPW